MTTLQRCERGGLARWFAVLATMFALLAGATGIAQAETDPALKLRVSGDEKVVHGAHVFTRGHVDVGPKIIDGKWQFLARDDATSPAVWRTFDDIVVKVPDSSMLAAPKGADYGFLGAAQGKQVYVIPQTQNRSVPWLGWNSQDPAASKAMGRGMTMAVTSVKGPGSFVTFLQDGAFGKPQLLWTSAKTSAQKIFIDANTHTHANWVFSKPGVYLVTLQLSAKDPAGKALVTSQTLRFAVGDTTTAAQAAAAKAPTQKSAAAAAAPVSKDSDGGGSSTMLLTIGAIVVALIVVALLLFESSRRRKLRRTVSGGSHA